MIIPTNAIYQSDCLALLERMDAECTMLVYLDMPPYVPPRLRSNAKGNGVDQKEAAYQKGLYVYLLFVSKMIQQARRVLAPNGSLFIQAGPHLVERIRPLLDQIFGERNGRDDILWPTPQRHVPERGRKAAHEYNLILQYSKSTVFVHHPQFKAPTQEAWDTTRYHQSDEYGAYILLDLTSLSSRPAFQFEWHGLFPPAGRSWKYSKEQLEAFEKAGRLVHRSVGTRPVLKQYLDERPLLEVGSVWDDIKPLRRFSSEYRRFHSQKPLPLLERIVLMGSNPGDLVVDVTCGSGTTLLAAQNHGRRWIGCDLSVDAVTIAANRLKETLHLQPDSDFFLYDQAFLQKHFPVVFDRYIPEPEIKTQIRDTVEGTYRLHKPVEADESRTCEYKEVKGTNPVGAIENTVDEYAVAFLNGEGGKIYWGIRNADKVVVGVPLTYEQRDKLRRLVVEQLTKIQPAVAPTLYRIQLHPVQDHTHRVSDCYVVEVIVPPGESHLLYFTGGGACFVKTDAGKRRLNGSEINEEKDRRRPR